LLLKSENIESLSLRANEMELIKPYYTTNQIQKWYSNPKNTDWIIYTNSRFKDKNNIKPYPNIKRHLDQFYPIITSDNKPYGLHRAREEKFFKGEKIIALRKCVGEPKFTYTNFDCYVSATFYIIKTNRINQKYLTAFFNSKLIAFWLKNKGKMQGNNYQLDKEPLLEIPIYAASPEFQASISNKVDQILKFKNQNKSSMQLENEIDLIIYKLYELNYDQVLIFEPEFEMSREDYEKFKI
jgi:adenine-specific DNA-methyltransferase